MKHGIFYAFTGVKTVPGTILVAFVDIAKNVGLKISTAALMALIAMGAANCKGGDGIDPPTHMTQSEWADLYDTKPRDGFHDDNGSTFDGTGYINGYDWKGWNKDGTYNKYTEQPWDPDGNKRDGTPYYDERGFNPISKRHKNGTKYSIREYDDFYYTGVDYDGNLQPVKLLVEDGDNNALHLNNIQGTFSGFRIAFGNRSRNLLAQFRFDTTAEEQRLTEAMGRMPYESPFPNLPASQGGAGVTGDEIVDGALRSIAHYIVPLNTMLQKKGILDFPLLLDTYRTQVYLDYRAKGKATCPAHRELGEFYERLGGKVEEDGIKAYFDGMVIPEIADVLNINKGRVESLFNHIANAENLYSILDDVYELHRTDANTTIPAEPHYTGAYIWRHAERTKDVVHSEEYNIQSMYPADE